MRGANWDSWWRWRWSGTDGRDRRSARACCSGGCPKVDAKAMRAIFKDPARQQEFARDGFTVARLLSEEEAGSVYAEIEAIELGKGFEHNSPNPYHATYFDEDVDYRRRALGFVRKAIEARAEQLLSDYRLVTAGFVVKRPGDGAVSLHRDWTLTETTEEVTLNFWCPLVDTDETNGTLRLVVGSHGLVPNIETAHVPSYFESYGEAIKPLARAIRVKAGEALIFDSGALHWSDANRSASPRPALLATWVPKESRVVFYAVDQDSGGERFELVDMDDGSLVEHTPAQLAAKEFSRPRLGFAENRNEIVSQAEFERRLRRRNPALAPEREPRPGAPAAGLLRRLYRRVKRGGMSAAAGRAAP